MSTPGSRETMEAALDRAQQALERHGQARAGWTWGVPAHQTLESHLHGIDTSQWSRTHTTEALRTWEEHDRL